VRRFRIPKQRIGITNPIYIYTVLNTYIRIRDAKQTMKRTYICRVYKTYSKVFVWGFKTLNQPEKKAICIPHIIVY
jgi:hypothetical protein